MKESRRARELLERWRKHCEEEHGVSQDDYHMNVVRWHKKNAPSCDFRGQEGGNG